MLQPILQINQLSIRFETEQRVTQAVQDLSFSIHKGETLAIVGESGSGKSVSSLATMQLLRTPKGKIITEGNIQFSSPTLGNIDLLKANEKTMQSIRGKEISMIFQEPMTALNPLYTCGSQMVESILVHQKISKKAAKEWALFWFEQVKLPNPKAIFDRYPHQISGGQKQRVMIAMAMCNEPSLLIADEPTTALDVTVQKTILELMHELQQKNKMAMLFITHDLGIVAEIANQVLVMYRGKMIEQNNTQNLFKNPQHPYTKGLLACKPPLDFRPKRLPTVQDFVSWQADGSAISKEVPAICKEDQTEERKIAHATMYAQAPILEIKNLNKTYAGKRSLFKKETSFQAVKDVSFLVYPQETIGLVGESGCGKSTLGRSILRLIEATSGEVIYKKQNILKLNKEALRNLRKEIQIVFQDPYSSLNPKITVGEAIVEPMLVHQLYTPAQAKEKAIELLEKTGLQAIHFDRYPHEFSGGQRQRIVIARALALNPSFVVCDESVSALDVSVQAQVLNLLNDLKKEFGFTCIFISHDLGVVKYMSDRMLVMQKGEIVEMGNPDEIYAHPQNIYTQELINAIPKINI